MSALKTAAAEVAAELEKSRPDLAQKLRDAMPRRGRPKGDGERNEWLADVWCEIADAIAVGAVEEDALAAAQKRTGLKESVLDDLWHLHGRPAVRALLIQRGRLEK